MSLEKAEGVSRGVSRKVGSEILISQYKVTLSSQLPELMTDAIAGILNMCYIHVVEQCSLCKRRGEAVSCSFA